MGMVGREGTRDSSWSDTIFRSWIRRGVSMYICMHACVPCKHVSVYDNSRPLSLMLSGFMSTIRQYT